MPILSAIIDSREPKWIQRLTFGGVPTTIGALEAGDVWAATDDGNMLVVERKTSGDLLGSIKDGRLFPQAAKMINYSKWAYVVIIGKLENHNGRVVTEDRLTKWNWNAVQGALITLQELGVRIVYADDFEKAVMQLANRDRNDVTIRPARAPSILSEGEAALVALPGIGPEKLNTLLEHTGTPAMALAYLTDPAPDKEITDIPGLGYLTRMKVRRALRLKDNELVQIHIIDEEKAQ